MTLNVPKGWSTLGISVLMLAITFSLCMSICSWLAILFSKFTSQVGTSWSTNTSWITPFLSLILKDFFDKKSSWNSRSVILSQIYGNAMFMEAYCVSETTACNVSDDITWTVRRPLIKIPEYSSANLSKTVNVRLSIWKWYSFPVSQAYWWSAMTAPTIKRKSYYFLVHKYVLINKIYMAQIKK